MTSNYPWGKIFTPWNSWGSNNLPSKEGNYYINLPPGTRQDEHILASMRRVKVTRFEDPYQQ